MCVYVFMCMCVCFLFTFNVILIGFSYLSRRCVYFIVAVKTHRIRRCFILQMGHKFESCQKTFFLSFSSVQAGK